uniref:Uncharacterized protein n=1 Tax=Arundo donax TaxID=35708 RepID=A0A0A8Y875_ARUDO
MPKCRLRSISLLPTMYGISC